MSELAAGGAQHAAPEPWSGRDDGPGAEHRRWHNAVELGAGPADVTLVGFACDEGVRRNHGRVGAFDGPRALRRQLGGLALHQELRIRDRGDVVVSGTALEDGQELLAGVVAEGLAQGLTAVLGGGHETAYGTFRGLEKAGLLSPERTLGILNFDAHFDLRTADRATSGTPFRQIAAAQQAAGRAFRYAVCGISPWSNTDVLFDAARELRALALLDTDCSVAGVEAFVRGFAAEVDDLYVTVDLDVLPAAVAPGVSAPAALGVDPAALVAGVRAAGASGKLRVADVVELNPSYDVDDHTARTAARILAELVTTGVTA